MKDDRLPQITCDLANILAQGPPFVENDTQANVLEEKDEIQPPALPPIVENATPPKLQEEEDEKEHPGRASTMPSNPSIEHGPCRIKTSNGNNSCMDCGTHEVATSSRNGSNTRRNTFPISPSRIYQDGVTIFLGPTALQATG